ncbi:hypothetical protein LCGC14_2485630, partial [marine sediment metagenome]
GNGGPGVINMTGGTMNLPQNLHVGDGFNAKFNMDGGTINVGGLVFNDDTLVKTFNLNGGTVNANWISLTQSYTLNIEAGTLIINGDRRNVINDGVTSGGVVAYGGTGTVLVDYDYDEADPNAATTTVTACPLVLDADLTDDCAVDEDDLELVTADWLFKTPTPVWSFDMDSDPVGLGIYDLNVDRQDPNGPDTYVMGAGTLELLGVDGTYLDSQFPVIDRAYDTTIHYVVKSTSADPVHLWFGMEMSTGEKSYVGISVAAVNGQTVEIWNGLPPHDPNYVPGAVATGFAASAYLDITVNYDYSADTFDWTVTDGTPQSGTGVAYTAFSVGNNEAWTIYCDSPATALIDQLDITIAGTGMEDSAGDVQPDGSVDLLDFAAIALEWLLGT